MPPTQKPTPTDQDFNDPDLQNSEQSEQGTQAQDVADDALNPLPDDEDVFESSPDSAEDAGDIVPRDVPDLVDNLDHMLRSGQIDMGAFEGEDLMDDEDEEDEIDEDE
jgi:hypothetical protein